MKVKMYTNYFSKIKFGSFFLKTLCLCAFLPLCLSSELLEEEGKGFEKIETKSDIWFWNQDMIKRWSRDKEEMMYYWVECEWRKLWSQIKKDINKPYEEYHYYLESKEISFDQAKLLLNIKFNFSSKQIYFVGPPKLNIQQSKQKTDFKILEEPPFEKDGRKFTYQKRGIDRPYFGKIEVMNIDEEDGSLWICLKPILGEKCDIGDSVRGHLLIYPNPPIEAGIIKINTKTNESEYYSKENGLPELKKYTKEDLSSGVADELEEKVLKPITIKEILIKGEEVVFNIKNGKVLTFDKKSKTWSLK